MEKISLGIVFGGVSGEYEESLCAAASVLEHIREEAYRLHKIGITKDGRMFYYNGPASSIRDGSWTRQGCTPCVISPDRLHRGLILLGSTPGILRLDAVFPLLYGTNGGNGALQGLLELAGLPFVGGACRMDGVAAHTVLGSAGVRQAKWLWTSRQAYQKNQEAALIQAESVLGYPCFAGPANEDTCTDLIKVENRRELSAAMDQILAGHSRVIVREEVQGAALCCGVIGNEEPVVSCVGELGLDDGNAARIPAGICEASAEAVRTAALRVYQVMGCRGMAQVDFFLGETGLVLGGLRTEPAFAGIFPQLFEAGGVSYAQLIDRLVGYALEGTDS